MMVNGTGKPLSIRVTIAGLGRYRSEEHTSELQSRLHLVCRLLLEKKKSDVRQDADRLAAQGLAVRQFGAFRVPAFARAIVDVEEVKWPSSTSAGLSIGRPRFLDEH